MARWSWFQHENDARGDLKFQAAATEVSEIQGCDHDTAACIAYAEYFQLLEMMDTAPGWMLDVSDPTVWRHVERSMMIQDGRFRQRIDAYLRAGLFQSEFMEDCGKLASEGFLERSMEREARKLAGRKAIEARWDKHKPKSE